MATGVVTDGLFDFRFKGADNETPGLIRQAQVDLAGELAILRGCLQQHYSRAVLEWFAQGDVPAFALAGRAEGLSLAGATIRKSLAITRAVSRLVDLGHSRLVMLVREDRRNSLIKTEFVEGGTIGPAPKGR